MKYLKWILKNGSRQLVILWLISVITGVVASIALIILWSWQIWGYYHGVKFVASDFAVDFLLGVYLNGPAWMAYYISDRKLFFDEYMPSIYYAQ